MNKYEELEENLEKAKEEVRFAEVEIVGTVRSLVGSLGRKRDNIFTQETEVNVFYTLGRLTELVEKLDIKEGERRQAKEALDYYEDDEECK